jgi:hypothetical protein
MTSRRHDHNLIAIVMIIISILIASSHPLPGLRDVATILPALVDIVTVLRK